MCDRVLFLDVISSLPPTLPLLSSDIAWLEACNRNRHEHLHFHRNNPSWRISSHRNQGQQCPPTHDNAAACVNMSSFSMQGNIWCIANSEVLCPMNALFWDCFDNRMVWGQSHRSCLFDQMTLHMQSCVVLVPLELLHLMLLQSVSTQCGADPASPKLFHPTS